MFTSEKYCVLPGQEPVRLASLSGNVVIVGETPRTIPVEFEQEAKGKGCITESQFEDLKKRLGVAPTVISEKEQEKINDFAAEEQKKLAEANAQRTEKIKQAVIEVLNNGDAKLIDKKGRPLLAVITEKTGLEVTEAELATAYEAATKG